MKLRKLGALPLLLSAGLVAGVVAFAPAASAATPLWEPDVNGNGGTIAFYDAAGNNVTSGNDLSHLFDYAVASSNEDSSGLHKASLSFAFPDHSQPTSSWFVNGQTAASAYPAASGPASITSLPATTPVAQADGTEMNLTAALGGGVTDSTAGYANTIQIRMTQSRASHVSYWTADIQYDTGAGTWSEVYPAVSTAVSTSTGLAASPVGSQKGGSPVTLTATLTPADAVGAVQFKDGAANLGSPVAVTSGSAQLVTSSLAGGVHSFTASFSPTDASAFAASSSAATAYTVTDASSLTVAGSKTVRYGSTTTTSATLKDTRTGHAVNGASLRLYSRSSTTGAWALVGAATTSSAGVAARAVKPAALTYYQWRFAGSSAVAAATSGTQTVWVSQVVTAAATPTTVKHGKTTRIYGTVGPTSSGQKVTLQLLAGRTWKNLASATVKKQKLPNGRTAVGYVFTVKLTKKGTFSYRVWKPATRALLAGYSAAVRVRAV